MQVRGRRELAGAERGPQRRARTGWPADALIARIDEAARYVGLASTYSTPADAPDPWNIVAFSQILTTVRFLNELGYAHITPQAVLTKAKAFTGPVALGAPALQCGKYSTAPAVCNDRAQFFEYKGKHVFTKVASWLQPPS